MRYIPSIGYASPPTCARRVPIPGSDMSTATFHFAGTGTRFYLESLARSRGQRHRPRHMAAGRGVIQSNLDNSILHDTRRPLQLKSLRSCCAAATSGRSTLGTEAGISSGCRGGRKLLRICVSSRRKMASPRRRDAVAIRCRRWSG